MSTSSRAVRSGSKARSERGPGGVAMNSAYATAPTADAPSANRTRRIRRVVAGMCRTDPISVTISRRCDGDEGLVENGRHRVCLIPRQHERGREPNDVPASAEHQDAAAVHLLKDPAAFLDRPLLGLAIANQLDADHQASAADIA